MFICYFSLTSTVYRPNLARTEPYAPFLHNFQETHKVLTLIIINVLNQAIPVR